MRKVLYRFNKVYKFNFIYLHLSHLVEPNGDVVPFSFLVSNTFLGCRVDSNNEETALVAKVSK